jgi:mono/diheme cytochrome c family protein
LLVYRQSAAILDSADALQRTRKEPKNLPGTMVIQMTTRAITALTVVALLLPLSVRAQDIGNVGHGRQIAQTICSACHVVSRGQSVLPNSEAPPFPKLADTPGMTSIALSVALQTSHRLMPNIILEPDERRDVIAFILSLK